MARILHLCLSNYYNDGTLYQENELVAQHVADGHEVLVIASTEVHSTSGDVIYTSPREYVGQDGARVVRLPYSRWLPAPLMRKLRAHPGVYKLISEFCPDTILFHGCSGWELRTVARYVKEHPEVPLYVDSHTDWTHSARNVASRVVLHKLYYRYVLASVLPNIRKILCVSTEVMEFARKVYRVPDNILEFYPLGGHPLPDKDYMERRSAARNALGITADQIVIVQSGKQTRRKKLIEALRAFSKTDNIALRFIVAGVIKQDIKEEAEELIGLDPRVTFAGWKNGEGLTDLLCAADVYLQPGTQSATMQHSLCCRCAIILDAVEAHLPYLQDNGWLVSDLSDLVAILDGLDQSKLSAMAENSYNLACEILDYRVLSKRILEGARLLSGDSGAREASQGRIDAQRIQNIDAALWMKAG